MWKPNSIIVSLYIFHITHPQKQKRSVQPFCFWGEHSKGLSNQADVELDIVNAISAADIAFIMSSSQAIVNWLNALNQSDFSLWVWCKINSIAVIGIEPAVKYSFVQSSAQSKLKGQYNGDLTLSLRFHVKPLITAIRAIIRRLVKTWQSYFSRKRL